MLLKRSMVIQYGAQNFVILLSQGVQNLRIDPAKTGMANIPAKRVQVNRTQLAKSSPFLNNARFLKTHITVHCIVISNSRVPNPETTD